jgi:hypothetical protein
MRGLWLIEHGWAVRGGGYASEVTAEGATLFHQRLAEAEKDLQRAYDRNSHDAAIPAALIHVGTGLSYDRDYLERQFTRATAIDPYNFNAHFYKWGYLLPQWYGSAEEAFEFARRSASQAPRGSELRLLLPRAHYERYPAKQRYDYYRRPEVWREIEEPFTEYLAEHPDDMRRHNWFALHAFYGHKYELARQEFLIIGDRWDANVWGTRASFERTKAKVFAGAGY